MSEEVEVQQCDYVALAAEYRAEGLNYGPVLLAEHPYPIDALHVDIRCALRALARHRAAAQSDVREALKAIGEMMGKHVTNWPEPKKLSTAIALIDKTLAAALKPPKHDFWGAGEPDCPREIKAGNGELHTLRCKRCGIDNPRDEMCRAALASLTDARHAGEKENGR